MKALLFIISLISSSLSLSAQDAIKTSSIESDIELKTQSGKISGTVSIPKGTETSPIVIIIPGSGPTDRDCNSPLGVRTNAYKMLAEDLAKNGISTLRFDKRGVGKSQMATRGESDLIFETYIDDVVAWISLLKMDKRFSKIILLGHSEGSLIGMIAASQTDVTSFISVAGVGNSADKLLKQQLKNLPLQLLTESNKILDSLKVGKTVSNVNPALNSIFRPSLQPYLISWIKYDPAIEIVKLKIPVLLIHGTTDLQVNVGDVALLSEAKPDAKLIVIDNMNHILKESGSDVQENAATYRNPELPLKSGLVDEIIEFVTIN